MWPTLAPGDRVLLKPLRAQAPLPEPGTIVISRHPFRPSHHLIKRLVGVDVSGAMILQGDHPAKSTDSRQLGAIPRDCLIGMVTVTIQRDNPAERSEHSS